MNPRRTTATEHLGSQTGRDGDGAGATQQPAALAAAEPIAASAGLRADDLACIRRACTWSVGYVDCGAFADPRARRAIRTDPTQEGKTAAACAALALRWNLARRRLAELQAASARLGWSTWRLRAALGWARTADATRETLARAGLRIARAATRSWWRTGDRAMVDTACNDAVLGALEHYAPEQGTLGGLVTCRARWGVWRYHKRENRRRSRFANLELGGRRNEDGNRLADPAHDRTEPRARAEAEREAAELAPLGAVLADRGRAAGLTAREWQVLSDHYGLGGLLGQGCPAVGRALHVSGSRAGQILRRAVRKVRVAYFAFGEGGSLSPSADLAAELGTLWEHAPAAELTRPERRLVTWVVRMLGKVPDPVDRAARELGIGPDRARVLLNSSIGKLRLVAHRRSQRRAAPAGPAEREAGTLLGAAASGGVSGRPEPAAGQETTERAP